MSGKPSRDEFVAALRAAGCDGPVGWANSEIEEDIPQFARYLLCKAIWEDAIAPWRQDSALDPYPEAQELLASGVDPERLRRLAGRIAYETMTIVVNTIDEGHYVGPGEVADDAPGWMVMEVDGESIEPTGRNAGFIHESILSVDPSGTGGAEFSE